MSVLVLWDTTYESAPTDGSAVSGGAGIIRTLKTYIRRAMRGWIDISVKNLSTDDTNFTIEANSVVEVNGTIIEVTAEETPTGWAGLGAGLAYCYMTTAGALSWSATVPTWSESKLGFYNSNDRAIAKAIKDGSSNYCQKEALSQKERDLTIVENRTSDPTTLANGRIWFRTDL